MTDCGNLINAVDHAVFRIGQQFQNQSNRFVVCRHGVIGFIVRFAGALVCNGAGQTDLFAKTLGKYRMRVHIKELILQ